MLPVPHSLVPRASFVVAAGFTLFVSILAFTSPLFMLQVYDRVLASRSTSTLVMLASIAVALILAMVVLDRARNRIFQAIGYRFDLEAARRVKGVMGRPDIRGFVRDIDSVRDFLGGHLPGAVMDVLTVPVFIWVCFLFHPAIGVVAVVGAILVLAVALLSERLTRGRVSKAYDAAKQASDRFDGLVRRFESAKALGVLEQLNRRWLSQRQAASGLGAAAARAGSTFLMAAKFVRAVLQVAILAVGAWLAIGQQISPGIIFATSLMMGRALAPIEQVVGGWKSLTQVRGSWIRLKTAGLLNQRPIAAPTALPRPTGRVDVHNLGVRALQADGFILRGISFSIEAGQVLAVIGPSGAGKSTLARSLANAIDTDLGHIAFDGAALSQYDPDALGLAVGYVPQDVDLFAGTVAENIARFTAVPADAILAASDLAGAHAAILKLPSGYDTQIGDGGVGLSGGQRQRIALARAFFGSPRIMILDEPNAGLDGEGEAALVAAVAKAKSRGCTVVLVTHKKSLLEIADKALVLNDGIQVAFGDAAEVSRKVRTVGMVQGAAA